MFEELSINDKITYIFYFSIFISIMVILITIYVVYNLKDIKGGYSQFKNFMDSMTEGFLTNMK